MFKPNGQRFWGQGQQGLFNPNGLTNFQLSTKFFRWHKVDKAPLAVFFSLNQTVIGLGVFKPNGSSFSRFRGKAPRAEGVRGR